MGSAILDAGCQGNFEVPVGGGGATGRGSGADSSSSTWLSSDVSASRMPSRSASSASAMCVDAAIEGREATGILGLGGVPANDGVPGALQGDTRVVEVGPEGGRLVAEGALEPA